MRVIVSFLVGLGFISLSMFSMWNKVDSLDRLRQQTDYHVSLELISNMATHHANTVALPLLLIGLAFWILTGILLKRNA